ncbi:MAG: Fe-S metabolism protein SufE [Rickettsiales bacterium]|nr:Fe-S metabolism protein SufE [Rickettsiales bacterium]|tara:strand:- start:454 stop:858 length:405 start_codon:yes stop_codon:yes gene_type:complete
MILDKIKARGDEMAPLEGHDRLQYLIDIAREVPPLDDKDKIEENKIRGCASNLWVVGHMNEDGTMSYKHDADSWITKGTAKVLVDLLNGEHRSEIAHLTLESFEGLGIKQLLTMQRQVGFGSLVERMITIAKTI